MFAEPDPRRPVAPSTLGEYIAALLEILGATQPAALARMRQIIGDRRARIKLDDESVEVAFGSGGLEVYPLTLSSDNSGMGETDITTTLELLDGDLEVTDAVLNGRLRVFGAGEDVIRIFSAIEILLDASPRTPALQDLAATFRKERSSRRLRHISGRDPVSWYPFHGGAKELKLLEDLDLLPEPSEL